MRIHRTWAMPSHETFSIPPIGDFVRRYLRDSRVSIDVFARNNRWATYTNDLNSETQAECHEDSETFLLKLRAQGVRADLILFDPPYSPRQIKECYDSVGLKMAQDEALRTAWKKERDVIKGIVRPGGWVLSFGWNSCGMGITRGFEIAEVMLVCHGCGHNDTICMAERKTEVSQLEFGGML